MDRISRQQALLWLLVITVLGLILFNWIVPTDPPAVEEVLKEEEGPAI